jgi:tetratricopeptide (TPR) repeat protein
MHNLSLRRWMGTAVIMAACCGATSAFAQTGGLTGVVKDEKGNILVGYPILIERQDIKATYKTKTDKKGTYVYVGLPAGDYKVTLQDPSGKTIFFIGQKVAMGDPTELDFDLVKEAEALKKQQEADPEVQKRLQEEAKAQKEFTGLKQTFDAATQLYADQKYAEAASTYEQAIPLAKGKNLAAVLAKTADSYGMAKQYDKSVDFFQKAIDANPADANLHINLGKVYADMGKIPEAQAEFQKSAQIDPTSAAKAYFNLGAIMYNQGKMDDAVESFKKATEIDPKYADAFFMEGRSLMGKLTLGPDGKVVPAPGTAEALQAYLQLDPTGKYAGDAQAMLQSIQSAVQLEYKDEKAAKNAPKKKKS